MDIRRAISSLFVIGFDGLEPPSEARRLVVDGVRGVVLFARNIAGPEQVADLCRTLKTIAPRPLLIAIDQEGGRVARLREGFVVPPPMRVLGEIGDATLSYGVGQLLGDQLRAVGIDLNFAPVLDVDTNPANPVIGDRSFGQDPRTVIEQGIALLRGLQSSGVAACAKHFPGHGDTLLDSHHELPRLPHGMPRLEKVELPPFQAAIKADVASIMTAHVIFEHLDDRVPATMSGAVIDGLLRRQLGYDGVVISDDLEMKAIAEHHGEPAAVVAGLAAGVDLFLCCHSAEVVDQCIAATMEAVADGRISPTRIREANRRLDRLAQGYVHGPRPWDGFDPAARQRHRAVLEQVADQGSSPSAGWSDPTDFRGP